MVRASQVSPGQGCPPTSRSDDVTAQCPHCRGTGWVVVTTGRVKLCTCKIQARKRTQLLSLSPKFRGVSLENYHPKNETQRVARERLLQEPGGSYFIFGDYGAGKTHVASAQFKIQIGNKKVLFKTTNELLHELQQMEMDSEYIAPAWQLPDEGAHLFWDDADKFKLTEFKAEAIYNLIDNLYRRQVGLTVTSNLSLRDLTDKVGPAVVRRIDDMCEVIELRV